MRRECGCVLLRSSSWSSIARRSFIAEGVDSDSRLYIVFWASRVVGALGAGPGAVAPAPFSCWRSRNELLAVLSFVVAEELESVCPGCAGVAAAADAAAFWSTGVTLVSRPPRNSSCASRARSFADAVPVASTGAWGLNMDSPPSTVSNSVDCMGECVCVCGV